MQKNAQPQDVACFAQHATKQQADNTRMTPAFNSMPQNSRQIRPESKQRWQCQEPQNCSPARHAAKTLHKVYGQNPRQGMRPKPYTTLDIQTSEPFPAWLQCCSSQLLNPHLQLCHVPCACS